MKTNTPAERGHNRPPDHAKEVTDRMARDYTIRRFVAPLATPGGRLFIVALAATAIAILAFASSQERSCNWNASGQPAYECAVPAAQS
jgi:hypothetical protein